MKDLNKIIEEAKLALKLVNEGETYTSAYVVDRFQKSASANPKDQLINNMRNVFEKRASEKMFITQKEIGDTFSQMYGIAGSHTAFRNELEDLLPESLKLASVNHKGSSIRTSDEVNPEPIYKESELSNAFGVLFSMGQDSSFASFSQADPKAIEKVVLNKLSSLGKVPVQVSVSGQNEHFVLATAIYQDRRHNQLALQMPIMMVGGQPATPELMIQGGATIPLNKENLYIHLKEATHYKKASKGMINGDVGRDRVEVDKAVLPSSLDSLAKFDTDMIKAASHFTPSQVNMGASLVATEIQSYTKVKGQVKVASSAKGLITFSTQIPTPTGQAVSLEVPVEYHNGMPILPSKFAVFGSKDQSVHNYYDFDKSGFNSLWSHLTKSGNDLNKIARIHGPMGQMSYHQLMDRIIEAAATKDYSLAEDAIGVISSRFGSDLAKKALDDYGNLLKHASPTGNKRQEFIKSATLRGELIEVPTTVEPFSPKLGLPISRIDFDSEGAMYPKGRVPKYDNQNDDVALMSTSKIYLS